MSDALHSFLPGPPSVAPEVLAALAQPPLYHRSTAFMDLLRRLRALLCDWTGARDVYLMAGSGTLANDVVASQLRASQSDRKGLVLSNGVFGERLADHAQRAGLRFDHATLPPDQRWDAQALERCRAAANETPAWLWLAQCETSRGVLNDLPALQAWCNAYGVALCVDAVSSLGTAPVDLRGVQFASSVSGKALGCVPGLALVFRGGDPTLSPPTAAHAPSTSILRSLDMQRFADAESVPHTLPGNLVMALAAALGLDRNDPIAWLNQRALANSQQMIRLRTTLLELGFELALAPHVSNPCVATFKAGDEASAIRDALEAKGLLIAGHSPYLSEEGLLQVCTFGDQPAAAVDRLIGALERRLIGTPSRQTS